LTRLKDEVNCSIFADIFIWYCFPVFYCLSSKNQLNIMWIYSILSFEMLFDRLKRLCRINIYNFDQLIWKLNLHRRIMYNNSIYYVIVISFNTKMIKFFRRRKIFLLNCNYFETFSISTNNYWPNLKIIIWTVFFLNFPILFILAKKRVINCRI